MLVESGEELELSRVTRRLARRRVAVLVAAAERALVLRHDADALACGGGARLRSENCALRRVRRNCAELRRNCAELRAHR